MSKINEAATSLERRDSDLIDADQQLSLSKDNLDVIFEQRRSWLCFGWHRPLMSPRWISRRGQYVTKAEGRPKTREYRGILSGKTIGDYSCKNFDYCIVVDENTDESGWQYGNGFVELKSKRQAMRRIPRRFDLVRRREWVKRSAAEAIKRQGSLSKKKSLRILDPLELRRWREESKAKL